ncbi:butyrate kinase [Treponema primitia]|uniref:butyrate kinase n=1 Tax=Treponema primitia TaxID=88058 RepID=UPI003981757B
MPYKILSINPGSTSTKIAVYEDAKCLFVENMSHKAEELTPFSNLLDQFDLRKRYVEKSVKEHAVELTELAAVVGRGGMLRPMQGGGYLVTTEMINELRSENTQPHASNLGAIIAWSIAEPLGIPAYIYDAVSSDEFKDIAHITGIPGILRESFCHVLNAKASARKAAGKMGVNYREKNFIVAHLGGGISVSVHEKGRIVDAIQADGGPFSTERAGSVPLHYIVDLCYSGKYTQKELFSVLNTNGGLKGLLGTNDCRVIEQRIADGDEYARNIFEAEAYQIAKGIGEMYPVLCGDIDAIILTGGMAYSDFITSAVTGRVKKLAPVIVIPGENEMESLTLGALRILKGEENYSTYTKDVRDRCNMANN